MTPRRFNRGRVPGGMAHAAAWKWLGLATAAVLLVGSTPAAGQMPAVRLTTTAAGVPASSPHPAPVTVPGLSAPNNLDPVAAASRTGPGWSPSYTPEVTSDGSAANGESVSRQLQQVDLAGIRRGLLPGNLALTPPVAGGTITSPYGWRLNPTGAGSYVHIGQDYGVPCGTPVRAAEAGVVVQSTWAGHSGQRVRMDHGSGVETAYSHNSLLVAKAGDRVERGSLLALAGTTGNSTGCHVHFEVYLNGTWVNPALYLPTVPGAARLMTPDEMLAISRSKAAGPATKSREGVHQHDAGNSAAARPGSPAENGKGARTEEPKADAPATKAPRTAQPKASAPEPKDSPATRAPAPKPPKTPQRPKTSVPSAPAKPGQPADPKTDPSAPPATPSAPAEPSEPSTPPAEPSTPPAEPSKPASPNPGTPADPPTGPSEPTAPPTEPGEPAAPSTEPSPPPATPSTPTDPTAGPSTPSATPSAPVAPSTLPADPTMDPEPPTSDPPTDPAEPSTEPGTQGTQGTGQKSPGASGTAKPAAQEAGADKATDASVAAFGELCANYTAAAESRRTAGLPLPPKELALLTKVMASTAGDPAVELLELDDFDEAATVGDASTLCTALFEDFVVLPAGDVKDAGK